MALCTWSSYPGRMLMTGACTSHVHLHECDWPTAPLLNEVSSCRRRGVWYNYLAARKPYIVLLKPPITGKHSSDRKVWDSSRGAGGEDSTDWKDKCLYSAFTFVISLEFFAVWHETWATRVKNDTNADVRPGISTDSGRISRQWDGQRQLRQANYTFPRCHREKRVGVSQRHFLQTHTQGAGTEWQQHPINIPSILTVYRQNRGERKKECK